MFFAAHDSRHTKFLCRAIFRRVLLLLIIIIVIVIVRGNCVDLEMEPTTLRRS